jgi:hypothetical protein
MVDRVQQRRWVVPFFALGLAVAGAGTALAQRTPGATAGSPLIRESTQATADTSSCVLMLQRPLRYPGPGITGASGGLADIQALTTAMTTTGMIDPAAKIALGLGPREWPKAVWIEITSAGTQAVKVLVKVDPGPNHLKAAEPAQALLAELVKRAMDVVTRSWEPRRQELSARLAETEKKRAELRATIQNLRKHVREAEMVESQGMAGPTQTLAAQRQQAEMDLAAKRPRLAAMKIVLSRIAGQADEVGKALRELVAAREALAAGLEKEIAQGKRSPVDLLRARADLAEARLRAAEWGSGSLSSPGGKLREEITGLEADIAGLEGQLRSLPLPPPERKPPAEDVQQVRIELVRTENESNRLDMEYQQLRREYDQLGSPPTLTVLDGQPH